MWVRSDVRCSLREAGIPVESASGPYGGYRIGRGARIPPLMFSTSEALGLVMAVLQGWHGSVDADHPAATALAKIRACCHPRLPRLLMRCAAHRHRTRATWPPRPTPN